MPHYRQPNKPSNRDNLIDALGVLILFAFGVLVWAVTS